MDESNGESTFEFVEKKTDECPVSAKPEKPATPATPPTSPTSVLTSLGMPQNAEKFFINISPPMALPSFVTDSMQSLKNVTASVTAELQQQLSTESQPESPKAETEPKPSTSTAEPEFQNPEAQDASSPTGSLFSWVMNSNVLSKVAEKAKNSVNSMITTLDPQMKEFLYSGGDVEIIVASDKEVKISPIREAFQSTFGKATVTGVTVNSSTLPVQPIGFEAGIKAAEERISLARKLPTVPAEVPVVAVENFLIELSKDKWYDLGVIVINDPKNNINLQTFTQMTPVPSHIVDAAQKEPLATPTDLSVTVGQLMAQNLQVHHTQWCSTLTGVSRRDIIYLAAQSLVGIYKNTVSVTQ